MLGSKISAIGLFVLMGVVLLPAPAWAQYDWGVEVYGGFSFLRLKPGEELDQSNLKGWETSVTGYFNEWVGMTAAFGGDYGSVNAPPGVIGATKLDINERHFLFGPQFGSGLL